MIRPFNAHKNISLSNIDEKEEIKQTFSSKIKDYCEVELKPYKHYMKEIIQKLKYIYKQHHAVYVYRCYKNKCRAWMDFSLVHCDQCGAQNYYFESKSKQNLGKAIELRELLRDKNLNIEIIKGIVQEYEIIKKDNKTKD